MKESEIKNQESKLKDLQKVFFIGVGGIGMSAIARYFNHLGIAVLGYDKTPSPLTRQLEKEGIQITYEVNVETTPKDVDLVVYTPAIPKQQALFRFYMDNDFVVKKRAEVLGDITKETYTIAVAGSHGKTSVSSMITHILKHSGYDCTAFIGGIMMNYDSNFVMGKNKVVVVEADEYDRSFWQLQPDIAVITAIDTDHLAIYGNKAAIEAAFESFANLLKPNGKLIVKGDLAILKKLQKHDVSTYGLMQKSFDYTVENIYIKAQNYAYKLQTPDAQFKEVQLCIGGLHNIENALAAAAVAHYLNIAPKAIFEALYTFKGNKRRFEYVIRQENLVMIDDYAHHPEEIKVLLESVRHLYPNKKISAIFQPHLFSRTQSLATEFAQSLDLADEVILLDIYPAREVPIPGVTSELILRDMKIDKKYVLKKEDVIKTLQNSKIEVLLTVGAGSISNLVEPIKKMLSS